MGPVANNLDDINENSNKNNTKAENLNLMNTSQNQFMTMSRTQNNFLEKKKEEAISPFLSQQNQTILKL
jgi:hypothetical protein